MKLQCDYDHCKSDDGGSDSDKQSGYKSENSSDESNHVECALVQDSTI